MPNFSEVEAAMAPVSGGTAVVIYVYRLDYTLVIFSLCICWKFSCMVFCVFLIVVMSKVY